MSFTVEFDAATGGICVRISGQLDRTSIHPIVEAVARLMREHACRAVINDLRDTDLRLGTVDLFEISRLVERSGFAANVPRATIVKNTHELAGFYETVNANLGHRVRVFTDMDEARAWIGTPGTR